MDASTSIGAVPFTAWEQAVFVALFIVMVIGLLGWFSKQQGNWQSFISKRDEQWQSWMRETNSQTHDSLEHVTSALEKLSEKIDAHDEKVDRRVSGVVNELRPKGSRKPK